MGRSNLYRRWWLYYIIFILCRSAGGGRPRGSTLEWNSKLVCTMEYLFDSHPSLTRRHLCSFHYRLQFLHLHPHCDPRPHRCQWQNELFTETWISRKYYHCKAVKIATTKNNNSALTQLELTDLPDQLEWASTLNEINRSMSTPCRLQLTK